MELTVADPTTERSARHLTLWAADVLGTDVGILIEVMNIVIRHDAKHPPHSSLVYL